MMQCKLVDSTPGRYGQIYYLITDNVIGRAAKEHGEWFETEVDVFRMYCGPGDVVIDVGSNIGLHTMALASIVGPEGHVVSLEPQKVHFMLTAANAAVNEYFNVYCYRMAAGKEKKVINCLLPDYTAINSYGGFEVKEIPKDSPYVSIPVQVAPLDEIINPNGKVKFIKIDVEGCEVDVVLGSEKIINNSHPVLYVENDRVINSKHLIETLWSMDYSLYWHIPKFFNPDNFNKSKDRLFALGHYVAKGQKWLCGVSVNLLCIPDSNCPIPNDVIPVGDSSDHPTEWDPKWLNKI